MAQEFVGESLGRRIAEGRAKLGLTQQQLADRLAISRVAVSHLEAGLSDPSERTVTLLASVFKLEPTELVAGTRYPSSKAERLPVVVARYTEVEHQLDLLDNDMRWVAGLSDGDAEVVLEQWSLRLAALAAEGRDPAEQDLLVLARRRLRAASAAFRCQPG